MIAQNAYKVVKNSPHKKYMATLTRTYDNKAKLIDIKYTASLFITFVDLSQQFTEIHTHIFVRGLDTRLDIVGLG